MRDLDLRAIWGRQTAFREQLEALLPAIRELGGEPLRNTNRHLALTDDTIAAIVLAIDRLDTLTRGVSPDPKKAAETIEATEDLELARLLRACRTRYGPKVWTQMFLPQEGAMGWVWGVARITVPDAKHPTKFGMEIFGAGLTEREALRAALGEGPNLFTPFTVTAAR